MNYPHPYMAQTRRTARRPRIRIGKAVIGFAVGVILTCIVLMTGRSTATNATDKGDPKADTYKMQIQSDATEIKQPAISTLLYTETEVKTETKQWQQPAEADIEMLAKLIWGEARGVKTTAEKAAVVWCVLNRVDGGGFPNTIENVVTQPHQFVGYNKDYPATFEHRQIAEDVLNRWYAEKAGCDDVGRVLPKRYTFFTGDGYKNYFTEDWKSKNTYDWSLPSPYNE